jgi:hypothetical protein
MPALARDLCWRQFELFATSGPYDQATAKLTLQPLINLGRLHTRDGNGTAAYRLHEALLNAAATRTQVRIDDKSVSFENIVKPGDDHRDIVRWLWTVLLADGIRALCRAGRWAEALHEAEQHHGIGQRLFDGRQVAIIAHCAAGDYLETFRLIDTTATPTAWEEAVVACMKAICLTWARRSVDSAATAMVDTYLSLAPEPDHAGFQARLGLTVADLTSGHALPPVAHKIERIAADTVDAYIARDVLTSPTALPLPEPTFRVLRETVRAAGLGTTMPPDLLGSLMLSIKAVEAALVHRLTHEQR